MEHFVAYHSVPRMGRQYESSEQLRFISKKLTLLKRAIGNTVWVIQGMPQGSKTEYTLQGAYIADGVAPDPVATHMHVIRGNRIARFTPPLALNDRAWFSQLLATQNNFSLGFNSIDSGPALRALTALLSEQPAPPGLPDLDLPLGVLEGSVKLVAHLTRERNRALVEAKKAATIATTGGLRCEVCSFDFSLTYGSLGEGFCEVHHLEPLSQAGEARVTRLEDLAVLCSNCHRIVHRSSPMLALSELAKMLGA